MKPLSLAGAALAVLLAVPAAVHAAGIEKLRQFIEATRSARSEFTQTVVDGRGRKIQDASGSMEFERPGRFRWTYARPYDQLIVGDGEKVWIYDKELKQVTVRALDQALGSTPAALLAGSNDIEKAFTLSESGAQGGLEWVDAVPKNRDTTFDRVRLGFDERADLRAMELTDSFGQTTRLTFAGFERNPKLDPSRFRFTPPPGADVVGG
ncbi:MAG: outer membrane lipoprotein chaperone LolA [Pseudomonadota bacterium]